jgi:inner membrane transporter RhtA
MTALHPPLEKSAIAPSVGLAVGAMVAVQLAAALSRPLIDDIGSPAFAWIRMIAAALILLAVARPRWKGLSRSALAASVLLGGTLAMMSVAFFAAINRLPLGLVTTIAFLGPLAVAVLGARTAVVEALGLAFGAGVGVVLMMAPTLLGGAFGWTVDPVGLGLALIAAMGWALYILLSRRVGSHFSHADGLCLSFVTAAVLLTPTGLGGFDGMPELSLILGAAMLAILAPLLPCWLEMIALRRLGTRSFGVLMCLEPAIATVMGLVFLHEAPGPLQVAGIACVILASVGAVRLVERQQTTA